MKRCPQCEFIYEDEETLCPMDGASLRNLTGPLPTQEMSPPRPAASAKARANSHGRGLTLIVGGLVLATALFVFYRNSLKRMLFPTNLQQTERYNYNPASNDHAAPAAPAEKPTPATDSDRVDPFRQPSAVSEPAAKSEGSKKSSRAGEPGDQDPFRPPARPENNVAPTPLATPSPRLAQPRANTNSAAPDSVSVTAKPNVGTLPPRTSAAAELQTKPANTNQKQDSKVKSFFKKTGRVLKKPFEQ
jgi:hypothetical protein